MPKSEQTIPRRPFPSTILGLCIFLVSAVVAADSWVSQGPFGGFTDAVVIDPVTHAVYAGNFGGGVLKSTDMGLHWSSVNTGFGVHGEMTINALATNPAVSGAVVAGSQNGIWITTNGGASWSATNVVGQPTDLEGPDVRAIAFAPSNPTRAYAAKDSPGGVLRSTDSGSHWTLSKSGITEGELDCIAVDATSADNVYTGAYFGGIFRSTDGGVTWTETDSGIATAQIDSLLVDPRQPTTVLAGTENGIYRSANSGGTWQLVPGPTSNEATYGLFAGPSGSTQMLYADCPYGGIFASANDGASWTRLDHNLPSDGPQAFVLDSVKNVAYAGIYESPGGIWRSTDGGVNWSPALNGYTAQEVYAVAIDSVSPAVVLAGTYGNGVFRSTDNGASWAATSEPAFVLGLYFDRKNSTVAYFVGDGGVFKSNDSGGSWVAINNGLGSSTGSLEALAQSGSGGILLTGDRAGDIFRSTDGGGTWQKSVTGLTATRTSGLAADPSATGTFFVETNSSIFKSVDGGLHWTPSTIGYPAGAPGAIVVDPFNSQIVLAGSATNQEGEVSVATPGASRSTNGGATWESIPGPLASQDVYSFAADPAHSGVVYAGAYGGGVFRSADHGMTWSSFSSPGLTNLNVVGLAVSSDGWVLETGTDSTSTFRYEFTGRMLVAPVPANGSISVVSGGR